CCSTELGLQSARHPFQRQSRRKYLHHLIGGGLPGPWKLKKVPHESDVAHDHGGENHTDEKSFTKSVSRNRGSVHRHNSSPKWNVPPLQISKQSLSNGQHF